MDPNSTAEAPLRVAHRNTIIALAGSLIASGLYAGLQRSFVSGGKVMLFLAVQVLVTLAYAAHTVARFHRPHENGSRWCHQGEIALAALHGSAWGTSVLYLWPNSAHPEYRLALGVVLVAATGAEATRSDRPIGPIVARSTAALIPFGARCIASGGSVASLGVGTTLLAVALIVSGVANRRRHTEHSRAARVVEELRTELAGARHQTGEAVRRVWKTVTRDELTGAHTKRYLLQTMQGMIEQSQPFVVAFAELDRGEDIRARFGKPVLHEVFRRITNNARTVFRDTDVVAHLGDGEFAVLMADAPLEAAMMRADQFRQMVERVIVREHPELQATVCVGVTEHLQHHQLDDVLVRGARSLQAAKLAGSNRVMFWQEADVDG